VECRRSARAGARAATRLENMSCHAGRWLWDKAFKAAKRNLFRETYLHVPAAALSFGSERVVTLVKKLEFECWARDALK
jgi:hypothetical protein